VKEGREDRGPEQRAHKRDLSRERERVQKEGEESTHERQGGEDRAWEGVGTAPHN
jgi:hypothetical protein